MSYYVPDFIEDLRAPQSSLGDKKKAEVEAAALQKKRELDPLYVELNLKNDADDFGAENFRLKPPREGYSIDTWETRKPPGYWDDKGGAEGEANFRKKLDKQRVTAAEVLGQTIPETIDDDIYALGEWAAKQKRDFFTKGQTEADIAGPFTEEYPLGPPMIEIRKSGEKGLFGRDLVDAYNPFTGESYSEFANNPRMNADFFRRWNSQKRIDDFKKELAIAALENPARARAGERTIGDTARDAAGIALGGSIGAAQGAWGFGNLVYDSFVRNPINIVAERMGYKDGPLISSTDAALDEVFGESASGRMARAKDFVHENVYSEDTKGSRRAVQLDQQKFALNQQKRAKAQEAMGVERDWFDDVVDWGERAINSVGAYVENPAAAIADTGESGYSMLAAGVIGKVAKDMAMKKATAGMTQAEKSSFVASEAGKEIADRAAERAGILVSSSVEGGNAYSTTMGEILNADVDTLAREYPEFAEILEGDVTPEQAKRQFAEQVSFMTALITTISAAGISKATGAGAFEGNLLKEISKKFDIQPDSGIVRLMVDRAAKSWVGQGLKRTGEGFVRESTEEGLQGLTGQVAENVAKRVYGDENQPLMENTAEAVGSGLAVGGLSGATARPQIAASELLASAIDRSIKGINAAGDRLADAAPRNVGVADLAAAREAVDSGTTREAINALDRVINPETVSPELVNDLAKTLARVKEDRKNAPFTEKVQLAAQEMQARNLHESAKKMLEQKLAAEAREQERTSPRFPEPTTTEEVKRTAERKRDAEIAAAENEITGIDTDLVQATETVLANTDERQGTVEERNNLQKTLDAVRSEIKTTKDKKQKAALTESRDKLITAIDTLDQHLPPPAAEGTGPAVPTARQQAVEAQSKKYLEKQKAKELSKVDKVLAPKKGEVDLLRATKQIEKTLENPLLTPAERVTLQRKLIEQRNNLTTQLADQLEAVDAAGGAQTKEGKKLQKEATASQQRLDQIGENIRTKNEANRVRRALNARKAAAELRDGGRDKTQDTERAKLIVNGIPVLGSSPEAGLNDAFDNIENSDAAPEVKEAARAVRATSESLEKLKESNNKETQKLYRDVKDEIAAGISDEGSLNTLSIPGHLEGVRKGIDDNDPGKITAHLNRLNKWAAQHQEKIDGLKKLNKTENLGKEIAFPFKDFKGRTFKWKHNSEKATSRFIAALEIEQDFMNAARDQAEHLVNLNPLVTEEGQIDVQAERDAAFDDVAAAAATAENANNAALAAENEATVTPPTSENPAEGATAPVSTPTTNAAPTVEEGKESAQPPEEAEETVYAVGDDLTFIAGKDTHTKKITKVVRYGGKVTGYKVEGQKAIVRPNKIQKAKPVTESGSEKPADTVAPPAPAKAAETAATPAPAKGQAPEKPAVAPTAESTQEAPPTLEKADTASGSETGTTPTSAAEVADAAPGSDNAFDTVMDIPASVYEGTEQITLEEIDSSAPGEVNMTDSSMNMNQPEEEAHNTSVDLSENDVPGPTAGLETVGEPGNKKAKADLSSAGKTNYGQVTLGKIYAILKQLRAANAEMVDAQDITSMEEFLGVKKEGEKLNSKQRKELNKILKKYEGIINSVFSYTEPFADKVNNAEAFGMLAQFALELRTEAAARVDRERIFAGITTETTNNTIKSTLNQYYQKHGYPSAADQYLNNRVTPQAFNNKGAADETTDWTKVVREMPKTNQLYQTAKQNAKSVFGRIPNVLTLLSNSQRGAALYTFLGMDNYSDHAEHIQKMDDFRRRFVTAFNETNVPLQRKKDPRYVDMHIEKVVDDPFIMLKDINNELPENILSAMAIGGWNWLGTQGVGQLYHTEESLNKVLGNDPTFPLATLAYEELGKIGSLQGIVVQDLGREIRKQLNLEAADGVDGYVNERLDTAIGQATIAALANMGLVEKLTVKNKDLNQFRDAEVAAAVQNPNAEIIFIRAAITYDQENSYWKHTDAVEGVKENVKEAKDVISALFDLTNTERPPLDAPLEKAPSRVGKSVFNVAQKMKDYILHQGQQAWVAKPNAIRKLKMLDPTLRAQMFGFEPDQNTKHVTQIPTWEGQNKTIVDDLNKVLAYFDSEESLSKPFWFGFNVWKVLRMGMDSNILNPQGSKIVRHLIAAQDFAVELDLKNDNHRMAFELALAPAFGVEVDKMFDQDAQDGLHAKIFEKDGVTINDTYLPAVKLLASNQTSFTEAEQQTIADAVAAGKEKAHTYDALLTLAEYYKASNGKKKFTMDLFREVDGITNGVISGLLQIPYNKEKVTRRLQQGGIHPTSANISTHSAWQAIKGNLDSYEALTRDTQAEMETIEYTVREIIAGRSAKPNQLAAILLDPELGLMQDGLTADDFFAALRGRSEPFVNADGTITKAGRKFSKNPLMISSYSAGAAKILEEYKVNVLADFYNELASIQDNETALQTLFSNMNTLFGNGPENPNRIQVIKEGNKILIGVGSDLTTYKVPREFTLSTAGENHYKRMMGAYYGAAQNTAIKELLKEYNTLKMGLVNGIRVSNTVGKIIFDDKVAQREEEYGYKLSARERELILIEMRDAGLLPGISHASSEGIKDLLPVYGMEKEVIDEKDGGKIKQIYNENSVPITRVNIGGVNEPTNFKQTSSRISIKTLSDDTGVASMVGGIQSIDANTNGRAMGEFPMLNVHDAQATNAVDSSDHSKTVNQIYWELNKSWSLAESVGKTAHRFAIAYEGMTNDQKSRVRSYLRKSGNAVRIGKKRTDDIPTIMNHMDGVIGVIARHRAEIFAPGYMGLISQYNDDRGGFNPNDKTTPIVDVTTAPNEEAAIKEFINDLYDYSNRIYFETVAGSAPIYIPGSPGEKLPGFVTKDGTKHVVDVTPATLKEFHEFIGADPAIASVMQAAKENIKRKDTPDFYPAFTAFLNTAEMAQEFYRLYRANIASQGEIATSTDPASQARSKAQAFEVSLARMGFYEKQDNANRGYGHIFKPSIANIHSYFSSPAGGPQRAADSVPLRSKNSIELFDNLADKGNVTAPLAHTAYLKNLLKTFINPALDSASDMLLSLGVSETAQKTRGEFAGSKIYIGAATGQAKSIFEMSAQEVYVHELVHAVWAEGINSNQWVRRELHHMLRVAKQRITPEMLIPQDAQGNMILRADYASELKAAKEMYDYIFNNGTTGIHEFAAFGLSNQQFRTLLSNLDYKTVKEPWAGSLWDKLQQVFSRVTDWLSSKYYGTANRSLDNALLNLANRSLAINNSNNSRLESFAQRSNQYVSQAWKNWILEPLSNIQFNPEKERGLIGNTVEAAVKTAQAVTAGTYKKAVDSVLDRFDISRDNFFQKLFTEMSGPNAITMPYHDLLRRSKHTIDSARESMNDSVTNQIKEMFTTPLSENESIEITTALLKTDIKSLISNTGTDLMRHLVNRGFRNGEIDKLEKKLDATQYGEFYKIQAKSLGHVMARGKAGIDHQLMNPYAIARMAETGYVPKGDLSKIEGYIDKLASLHALNYTDAKTLQNVAKIVQRENRSNATENGITFLLGLHDHFAATSLERLFSNNPMQTVKGFTSEMYDRNITFQVGTEDDIEVLRQQGYGVATEISHDPKDPNKTKKKYLFTSRQGLNRRWMSGITSLTAKAHKGTDLTQAYHQESNLGHLAAPMLFGEQDVKIIKQRNKAGIQAMINGQASLDFETNHLVPVLNEIGGLSTYRYMMAEDIKLTHLNKKDEVHEVMGEMFARMVDKDNTGKINDELVQLTFDDFQTYGSVTPKEFVFVGLESGDEKLRELYQMLPQDMRNTISRVWGKKGMYVREDQLDLIFGYRKVSAVDALDRFSKKITGRQIHAEAKNYMRLSGMIWSAIVSRAKRNVVILNPAVITANVISNTVLLATKGVAPHKAIGDQIAGVRAITKYQSDIGKRDRLQRRQDTGAALSQNELNNLRRLNEEIRTNPVTPLVDAGLFQSIIEDINPDEQDISDPLIEAIPKLRDVGKFINERTETGVSKTIRDGAVNLYKYATIAPDTKMGLMLLKATQYSDFVARYALYKHRTSNGVSEQDAIHEVINTFVNYDLPTSPQIQWVNDMGLFMYTKFLLRIQRVILETFRDNPANALAVIASSRMVENMDSIYESNLLSSLHLGRLNGPGDILEDAFVINLLNFIPFF